jgi:hypothetical protein
MAAVQAKDPPAVGIRHRLGNRGDEPPKRPGISLSSRLRLRGSVLDWTLAALGMLLAGWLRWSGLGRQSLWVDEMSSFGMANTGLRHVIPVVLAFDGHPPLYILVVHFADFVFKLGTVDSVRVPSVLAGIATVGIVYALARLLVGRLAAILCIALVTLSPLLVWYSREGRMYALTWLFVMLSYLALVQAARSGRRIWLSRSTPTSPRSWRSSRRPPWSATFSCGIKTRARGGSGSPPRMSPVGSSLSRGSPSFHVSSPCCTGPFPATSPASPPPGTCWRT